MCRGHGNELWNGYATKIGKILAFNGQNFEINILSVWLGQNG